MRCEECMSLVEDYVDGELDQREAEQLAAHISLCASCAEAADELVREQEVYARYQREVEVTPAMWHAVSGRIEEEKAARPSNIRSGWHAWLAETFGTNSRLRPAFGIALVLIALGITTVALVKYLNSRQSRETMAGQFQSPRISPNELKPDKDIAHLENVEETATGASPDRKAIVAAGMNNKRKAFVQPPVPRDESSRSPALTLDEVERTAALVAARDESAASASLPSDDPQTEIARHVEKAQMLLRSFKNVRLAETEHAPDISYEKGQARKLLYRNMILSREAAAQGNSPAGKLLSALEPILLDIANLPDHPTDADVRSIEQRMRKKEIMTALQVHSIIAQNSY
jgi:hypothetical protein